MTVWVFVKAQDEHEIYSLSIPMITAKSCFLESKMEENKVLTFLDIRIQKTKDGRFVTSWFKKKCAAEVFFATGGVTLMKWLKKIS